MDETINETERRRRRWPGFLLAAYAAVVLYGTLMPFKFTAQLDIDSPRTRRRIELVPFTHLCPKHGFFCPADFGVNIAMLAPIGALIVLLPGAKRGRWARVMGATVICLAASTSIELVQLFLPSRNPGTSDIVLNTLGGFLAALITSIAVRHLAKTRNPG
jgi:glycopeptide antibiotics resistance protein